MAFGERSAFASCSDPWRLPTLTALPGLGATFASGTENRSVERGLEEHLMLLGYDFLLRSEARCSITLVGEANRLICTASGRAFEFITPFLPRGADDVFEAGMSCNGGIADPRLVATADSQWNCARIRALSTGSVVHTSFNLG